MKRNLEIILKPELSHVINRNEVFAKKNKFIISDLNFKTITDIIRVTHPETYRLMIDLDQEKLKFAINSIISENKNLSPNVIINYICSLNLNQLEALGNSYFEIISEFLHSSNFQQKDNKGLIFINSNLIDFEFIFRNFPNIEVLFIFNEENNELILIDRNLNVLGKFKDKKEIDISDIFDDYDTESLKKSKNRYYNNLMYKLLEDYFSTDTFMENFLDEIFFKLSNLIIMADEFEIDERNLKLLEEHYKDLCKNEKVESALIKLLSGRNQNKDKYSEIQNIIRS